MKYVVQINIMPQKALLDPQGKAVLNSAKKNGFNEVNDVRIGKNIEVEIEADSKETLVTIVDNLCQKILVNPIIEFYTFTIL